MITGSPADPLGLFATQPIVPRSAPQQLKTFAAHCLHQATLWQIGDIGLQQAADELRFKAAQHGLIASCGSGEIEWIIGCAFSEAGVHYGDIRPLQDMQP
jgi:hypothetical protein